MSSYKSIGRLVSSINRYQQIYLTNALKHLGLHGAGQVRIVMVLSRAEHGISQEDLAAKLMIDKASISRMVRPLLKNGIIQRTQNPHDRRAYILTLHDFMKKEMPRIQETLRQWTVILGKGMSGAELKKLFSLLEKAESNAKDFLDGAQN